MFILGISISHDGTLSLVKDGEHIYSLAEERINRTKAYIGFPFEALNFAINEKVFEPSEITHVSVSLANFSVKHLWALGFELTKDKEYYDFINEYPAHPFRLPASAAGIRTELEVKEFVTAQLNSILKKYGIEAPIHFIDHHQCHAASAYFSSGFETALAITMDGEGDGLSATVSMCNNGEITRISETDRDNSAGYLYSEVTRLCGFKANRHEGKITGLAAYGNVDNFEFLFDRLTTVDEGKLKYTPYRRPNIWNRILRRVLSKVSIEFPLGAKALINQFKYLSREDISAGIQNHLEKRVTEIVRFWIEQTGIATVVFAGGLFANVKINQKVAELSCVESTFIYPDMGDGGNAYGAAISLYYEQNRISFEPKRMNNAYFGPEYSDDSIAKILSEHGSQVDLRLSKDVAVETAELLSQKKVVGWFQGRMEYGPRALGNRSILASAHDKDINSWLNQRMRRNEFMPFAPSCLYERAEDIFDIDKPAMKYPAEFMTITFPMKKYWIDRAPAVAHVDNTARPQLVSESSNPLYYKLIKAYSEITGVPIIINTSFNVHEEPIVCNPNDGVKALMDRVIDVFVCGNYICTRKEM